MEVEKLNGDLSLKIDVLNFRAQADAKRIVNHSC